jgi:hypothetical protein
MISLRNMESPDEAGSICWIIHRPKIQAKDKESNKVGREVEKTSHFCVVVNITGILN